MAETVNTFKNRLDRCNEWVHLKHPASTARHLQESRVKLKIMCFGRELSCYLLNNLGAIFRGGDVDDRSRV